jgi:hypothetical protein
LRKHGRYRHRDATMILVALPARTVISVILAHHAGAVIRDRLAADNVGF